MERSRKLFIIPERDLKEYARSENIGKIAIGVGVMINGKLLLVRRTMNDFLGGFYELPGGSTEDGETIETTLKRELAEETGLEVSTIYGMFEGFDYEDEIKAVTRQYNFAVEVKPGEIKLNSSEHDHYLLVDRSELENVELTPEIRNSALSFFELLHML